jgi:hypothetical protein
LPTHRELLDNLAIEFVEEGWSIKRMLRRMVLTRTYQMSSHADAYAQEVDPDNRWLHAARIRRLSGEEIRDAMLKISGELKETMHGRSVPIHLTPFMQGRGRPGSSGPLDGDGRRSVYIEVRRNFLDPMMLAFDTPIPFNAQGRRNVSNVPAQALIMMNSPLVHDQARKWSQRTADWNVDDAARVNGMIYEALGRPATQAELDLCLEFLGQTQQEGGAVSEPPPEAWNDVAHVIFNMKSFLFVF